MAQTIGTVLIDVKADTQQLIKGFNRAEKSVAKTTKDMKNAVLGLTTAYLSLTGAVNLGKSFIKQADAMNLVSSRLKLVTKDSENLLKVEKQLFAISQNARTGYASTSDLFARVSRSAKEYNIEQSKVLNITDSISKALIISGESASSSQAALVQLGQAFSSDFQAVGQELGSLREQAPRVYEMMVNGLGVTRAEFKKMAEDGKLSTEIIIEALTKSAESVEVEFNQMVKTVDQSMIQASNATQKLIAEIDNTFQITKNLSDSFTTLSESIENIGAENIEDFINLSKSVGLAGASLIAASTVLKTYTAATAIATTSNALYAGTFGAVNRAIVLTTLSTRALTIATKSIPFVAIASTIYLVADALLTTSDNAEQLNKTLSSTKEQLSELTKNQLEYQKALLDDAIYEALQEVEEARLETVIKRLFESEKDRKKQLAILDEKSKKLEDLKETYKRVTDVIENLNKTEVETTTETIKPIIDKNKAIKQQLVFFEALNKVQIESQNIKERLTNESLDLIIAEAEETQKLNNLLNEQSLEIENIANTSLKNSEDAWLNYYQTISNYSEVWAIKEKKIIENNEKLIGKENAKKLAKIKKTEYFDKIEKDRTRNYAKAKKDQEQYELDQLKSYGTISDGFAYQFKEQMPNDFETGVDLMKNITASFSDGWEDFFDRQSDSWGDWGDLAKSVLRDIEKQMLKSQVITPLAQASSSILSSVGGSLIEGLFSGWADGGPTTRTGSDKQIVGAVHANEYVIPAWQVRKYPEMVTGIEAIRQGKKGFDVGGFAGGDVGSSFDGSTGNYGGYDGGSGLSEGYEGGLSGVQRTALAQIGDFLQDTFLSAVGSSLLGTLGAYAGKKGSDFMQDKGYSFGNFLSSFGKRSIDLNISNTEEITDRVVSDLENYFDNDGTSSLGFTSTTTPQDVADIITELGTKKDVIEATSELFAGMVGNIPEIKEDATLAWNELFNAYIENGNSALLKTALDGSLFNTPDFYKAWETYASELNTSVEDAIKSSLEVSASTRNAFTEFTLRNDEVGLAKYQADYLTSIANEMATSMGIDFATITSENFLDKYNDAISESFTPETINKWNGLSDAFINATKSQEDYINSLNTGILSASNFTSERDMLFARAVAANQMSLASFAVGTSNVPYDMTANIHRGEIIVPSNFSQSLRDGDLSIGNNNEITGLLKILIEQNREIIDINSDININTRESRIIA